MDYRRYRKRLGILLKLGKKLFSVLMFDENLGDEVKITVLGATALEPLIKSADVAPVAQQVMELASPQNSHIARSWKTKRINRKM